MKKNKEGFTFAEVMITLVIIGIVSMLVVPNLLDSSTKKVNIAAAKKAKYEIAQASLMAQTDCMRWRCPSGTTPAQAIQSHLRNTSEIKYRVFKTPFSPGGADKRSYIKVLANVDGTSKADGSAGNTSVGYLVTDLGTIVDITNCTVKDYEDKSGVITTVATNNQGDCTAWTSTKGNANWLACGS